MEILRQRSSTAEHRNHNPRTEVQLLPLAQLIERNVLNGISYEMKEKQESLAASESQREIREELMSRMPHRFSRRQVLKQLAAAGAGIALFPKTLSRTERSVRETPSLKESITTPASERTRELEVRPEYERYLEEVIMFIPGAYADPNEGYPYIITYLDFFARLPSYTRVKIIAETRMEERIRRVLEETPISNRYDLLLVSDRDRRRAQYLDIWTQDFGEVVWRDGKFLFLVPMEFPQGRREASYAERTMAIQTRDRKRILIEAFGATSVRETPFYFEGGNMTFDRAGNEMLRVFVGYNDIDKTVAAYEALGRRITPQEIESLISREFGGAEVVVMGVQPQSKYTFHLDQSFLLLAKKTVVINKPAGSADNYTIQQQSFYRAQLEGLGYTLFSIVHTQDDLAAYRSSVTAVPFVDRETNTRKVIFPVFEGETRQSWDLLGKTTEPLQPEDLLGKARRAYNVYERAGYEPLPIRETTSPQGSAIHCLTNVISRDRRTGGDAEA